MALETVVHPNGSHYGVGVYELMGRPPCSAAAPWCSSGELCCDDWDDGFALFASLVRDVDEWEVGSSTASAPDHPGNEASPVQASAAASARKRRRAKVVKNKEEVESQRMTHIAVERNRRRQMNDYLAVLRSLMPPSYAQRGDQASIVGGAINYVRQLEQLLQTLEVQKSIKQEEHREGHQSPSPFTGFFNFPQYSTTSSCSSHGGDTGIAHGITVAIADIEATMVEGHASVKVQAPRRPRQLLKLVTGLQQLGLTILHLNVTTVANMVMYSFSLKVEDGCKQGSVEEIASAMQEILGRIQEEAGFS